MWEKWFVRRQVHCTSLYNLVGSCARVWRIARTTRVRVRVRVRGRNSSGKNMMPALAGVPTSLLGYGIDSEKP